MKQSTHVVVFCLLVLLVLSLLGNFVLLQYLRTSGVEVENGAMPVVLHEESDSILIGNDGEEPACMGEQGEIKPVDEAKVLNPLLLTGTSVYSGSVTLRFDQRLPRIPYDLIEIDPQVAFSMYHYGRSLEIRGDFQPGAAYAIRLKKGFPGNLDDWAGREMDCFQEDAVTVIVGQDRYAQLDFVTNGRIYPLYSDIWSLPISGVNFGDEVTVVTKKAYDATLPEFFGGGYDRSYRIGERKVKISSIRNEDCQFGLDLAASGVPKEPGSYSIRISGNQGYCSLDSCRLVVTNMGIVCARSGRDFMVAVRSLQDNSAVGGADVTIYSRKHQVVARGRTDASGYCHLKGAVTGDIGDHPVMVVASKNGDVTYAELNCRETVADLPMRGMVFAERGICRPGEKLGIYGVLRDGETLTAKGGVPLEFVVRDSLGNAILRQAVVGTAQGFYSCEVVLAEDVPTGKYSVRLCLPGNGDDKDAVAVTDFLVGEYVPDQIKLVSKAVIQQGTLLSVSGNASYYFGTPVPNGKLRIAIDGKWADFSPKGYEEYTFGNRLETAKFLCGTYEVNGDAAGNFMCDFSLDDDGDVVNLPVRYVVTVSALNADGGRAVSSTSCAVLHGADFYVGVAKAQSEALDGCALRLVAVTPEGEQADILSLPMDYRLSRISWDYVLKKVGSGYERVWERSAKEITNGRAMLDDNGHLELGVLENGIYEVEFTDGHGNVRAATEFWHYYGEGGIRSRNPRQIVCEFDKEAYLPGDVANVKFESMVDGVGLVMAGGVGRIATGFEIPVKRGINNFKLPIPADYHSGTWQAGLVVVSNLLDKSSDLQTMTTIMKLEVDQTRHAMSVALAVPATAKPEEEVTISITLRDSRGKLVSGEAVVWGVDEGILAFTGYECPDVFKTFFGRTDWGMSLDTTYDLLYPLVDFGTEKMGGGKAKAYLSDLGEKAKAAAIVRLGIVQVKDGKAKMSVKLPRHTGAMRIFAVAVNDSLAGSGDAEIVMRDDVSIVLHAPRFAAPGDKVEIFAHAFDHGLKGESVTLNLLVDVPGAKVVAKSESAGMPLHGFIVVALDGAMSPVQLPVKAVVVGASGREWTEEAYITVRPPVPSVPSQEIVKLAPGDSLDVEIGSFGKVSIGSPVVALSGALDWLNEYPYGCLEQTAATAFPYLALPPLVKAGMFPDCFAESAKTKLNAAVSNIMTMRTGGGWFAMWPGGKMPWIEGSLFADFFLMEAKNAGIAVDAKFCKELASALKIYLNDTVYYEEESRALANFVLAYLEPAVAAQYTKLINVKKASQLTKFLVGATLAKAGHGGDAMLLLKPLLNEPLEMVEVKNSCFASPVRRAAIILWVLSDICPGHAKCDELAQYLQEQMGADGAWGTTQNNAWAVLGLSRYAASVPAGRFEVRVNLSNGAYDVVTAAKDFGPGKYMVENTGDVPAFVCIRDRRQADPAAAVSSGVTISRRYLDQNGEEVHSARVGDLLQVEITVGIASDMWSTVVSDLLPGGLEIEDPNLMTRSRNFSSKEIKTDNCLSVTRCERRFDRYLAYGDAFVEEGKKSEAVITYAVRATTAGEFAVPPVAVESMYNPQLKAVTPALVPVFRVEK